MHFVDAPANNRPNVFTNILKASKDRAVPTALQAEIHYRSTKDFTRFTILLNNMRLMGVFDWLLAVQDFLMTGPENPFAKKGICLFNFTYTKICLIWGRRILKY